MNLNTTRQFVETTWTEQIIPALQEYLTIPNQSPLYDPHWNTNGYLDQATDLIATWIRSQNVPGLTLDVERLPGRTPLLFIEIPGDAQETVLLYGHLDKQPPMDGWNEGLGPWNPVLKDGKLYGRGGADDGYSAFASLTAIQALKQQGIPHARCVIIIEACEESGSTDLPHYIEALKERIGTPSLVVCLDSGCGNYEQLWVTCSLRGLLNGILTISTLTEGVHSGAASGIVPSTFRILRQLLSRLEGEKTGEILPREFYAQIPEARVQQTVAAAHVLGDSVYSEYPFQQGVVPVTRDFTQALLNRTWRPQLAITGAAGLPPLNNSGNVLRPVTAVKVSLRIPPLVDAETATVFLKQLFENDPPYGATITLSLNKPPMAGMRLHLSRGLSLPSNKPRETSSAKKPAIGEKVARFPLWLCLGKNFRMAQFVITGVLGPRSNAHGPNEFLDIVTGKRLTCCVARVLADHFQARCS